jgi:UDP-N-acetylmuramoylalanine--D-glutamate ligase
MENDLVALVEQVKTSGRQILVIGLGESGCGVLEFLFQKGISALGVEKRSERSFLQGGGSFQRIKALKEKGVPLIFGVDNQDPGSFFDAASLAIISPGVPIESAVAGMLRRKSIPIVAEMDFSLAFLRDSEPDSTFVLIAGSQGKSTTLSLICHFLQKSGIEFCALGHNNSPFVSELLSQSSSQGPKKYIVESSGFQLESSFFLRPEIAVLLNLSSKHLERYGSMRRFSEVLRRVISAQQKQHYTIFNGDDSGLEALSSAFYSIRGRFGVKSYADEVSAAISYSPDQSMDSIRLTLSTACEHYDLKSLRLPGLYNRYNAAAAICTARLLGASSSSIKEGFSDYAPLEHRMEIIDLPDGRVAVNDSKSTTVAATCSALSSALELWPTSRIALLLGGRAGACEWSPLVELLTQPGPKKRVTPVVYGEDKNIIASHLRAWDVNPILEESFFDAVERAYRSFCEVMLLSPACASFDEFKNFEQRGQQFKIFLSQLSAGSLGKASQ